MVIFNSYVSHYQRVQITATNGQNGWESPPWSSMDLRCFLQQQEETCNALGFFHVKNDTWMYKYPLVNIQKTMGNHHAINGKFHYKWPFSIAMLVYQIVFFCWQKTYPQFTDSTGGSLPTWEVRQISWRDKILNTEPPLFKRTGSVAGSKQKLGDCGHEYRVCRCLSLLCLNPPYSIVIPLKLVM